MGAARFAAPPPLGKLYRAPVISIENGEHAEALRVFDRTVLLLNPTRKWFERHYVHGEYYGGLPGTKNIRGTRAQARRIRREVDREVKNIRKSGLVPVTLVTRIRGNPNARIRQLIALLPVEEGEA